MVGADALLPSMWYCCKPGMQRKLSSNRFLQLDKMSMASPHIVRQASKMATSIRLHISVATFALATFASTSANAALCTQGARYERKDGAYIYIATPSESSDGLDRAHFELQSLGNIVAGAPTVGNLEGELTFTRDSCAGFFSSPDIQCALIVTFKGNRAQAYQIGYCYSGAGAYADGVYFKIKDRQFKARAK